MTSLSLGSPFSCRSLRSFIILIATRPLKTLSAFISVGAVLGSFVCACLIFLQQTAGRAVVSWIDLGPGFLRAARAHARSAQPLDAFHGHRRRRAHPHLFVRLHAR